jgi:hypothetical protein
MMESVDKSFRNHVKKDLDPYICVFDGCPEPCQLYSSSEEWLSHMSSQHRTRWYCVAKDHPALPLDTREQFISHMEETHPGRFKKDQLGFIADSCARPIAPTIPNCPFCSEAAENLDAHVGQHLHHFALISMPWPDDPVEGAEGASPCVSDESSGSDRSGRATLLDDFDDIPPTAATPEYMVIGDVKLITEDPPPLDHPVVYGEASATWIPRRFPDVDETLEQFRAAWKRTKRDQLKSTSPVEAADEDGGEMSDHSLVSAPIKSSTVLEGAKNPSRVQHPVVVDRRLSTPSHATRPVVSIRAGEKRFEQFHDELTSLQAALGSGQNEGDIDCTLLTAKCEWGILREPDRPAAVLYMDVAVGTPYDSSLQGCSIEMTLLDQLDTGIKASGSGLRGGGRPWDSDHLEFTDCYGPVSIRFGDPYGTQSALSSQVSCSGRNGKANDTITWDIEYDWAEDGWAPSRPLPSVYHLAFAIEHNAHDFFLRIKASKKLASRTDRIKSRLRFAELEGFRYDEVEIRFQFPDGYGNDMWLDGIALGLSSAMELENML